MDNKEKTHEEKVLEIAEKYYIMATRRMCDLEERMRHMEKYRMDKMNDAIMELKEHINIISPDQLNAIAQCLQELSRNANQFQGSVNQMIEWQKDAKENASTFKNHSIMQLELSQRLMSVMVRLDITDLLQLWDTSPRDLITMRGMGVKTRNELWSTLLDCGFPIQEWYKTHGMTPPNLGGKK